MTTTNADIDRRLSALERDMALVQKEQSHLRELFSAKFTVVENGLSLLSAKLDTLLNSMTQQAGDPNATPAGRIVMGEIEELRGESEERREDHEAWRSIRGAWKLIVPGGLAMLAIQAVLAAKAFGLL